MISLIHGCFEKTDISSDVNLIIADPPDNCGKSYVGVNDSIPDEEYRILIGIWLRKCCELSTEAPVFFIPAEKWMPEVEMYIRKYDIRLVQRIIWHFTFGQHHTRRYGLCFRPIYWLNNDTIYPSNIRIPSARETKYNDKRHKVGGKMPENVWTFSRICGTFKEKRKWHECQLPEQMIERIVLGHSCEEDVVFDPFVGSGTTVLVSASHRRNVIGLDASEHYLHKIQEECIDRFGSGTDIKIS